MHTKTPLQTVLASVFNGGIIVGQLLAQQFQFTMKVLADTLQLANVIFSMKHTALQES